MRHLTQSDLAAALNNLSVLLGELGRRDEALTAMQRAAQIYEQLAARNLDAYQPDLAMALVNMSDRRLARSIDSKPAIPDDELAGVPGWVSPCDIS